MKKFELTSTTAFKNKATVVYRIRALRDIPRWNVKAGDLGGFLEYEHILSQDGDAWVAEEAVVTGSFSLIKGAVYVGGESLIFSSTIDGEGSIQGDVTIQLSELNIQSMNIYGRTTIEHCYMEAKKLTTIDAPKLIRVKTVGLLEKLQLTGTSSIEAEERSVTLLSGNNIALSQEAKLQNAHSIHGKNVDISGHACLLNGASIMGEDITLSDFVSVEGNVIVADNVHLSEMVTVNVNHPLPLLLKKVTLSGDIHLTEQQLLNH